MLKFMTAFSQSTTEMYLDKFQRTKMHSSKWLVLCCWNHELARQRHRDIIKRRGAPLLVGVDLNSVKHNTDLSDSNTMIVVF